jgi:hypothetical protein
MLEPQGRKLLFDVLRPPEDHTLDFAVGTTYTLDLLALLIAPVAFTLFEADDPKKLLDGKSLALLESLRRYADRIAIFCHAGHISVPRAQFPQFEYLERIVIECQPTVSRAVFHPKIWLLRFSGPNGLITYRFACLSRNLTFDRCWDTVLALEGLLHDRQNAFAVNHPLADFVKALPGFAKPGAIAPEVLDWIARMESEVRRVKFEPPDQVDEFSFHPLGLPGQGRDIPFDGVGKRMLVMSPFVTDDGLKRIVRDRENSVLISRPESLQELETVPSNVTQVFALNDQAEPPGEETDEVAFSRGLHAKCYVVEDGWKASLWTGSANATEQGFNGNVEFIVELVGPKSKLGIDALLSKESGKTGFSDLLVPFSKAPDIPQTKEDEFRAAADSIRQLLVDARLKAVVTNAVEAGRFNLTLVGTKGDRPLPTLMTVSCWPITLGEGWKRLIGISLDPIVFEGVSLEALTSFFAFEVQQASSGEKRVETFVLNTTLEGAPPDRRERLLRSLIGDRQRFVQLLMCILADEGFELSDLMQSADRHRGADVNSSNGQTAALFESLMKTLSRHPERLDHIAALLANLEGQEAAATVLPEGFGAIWKPIWEARQER